jgi:hypothetical protein
MDLARHCRAMNVVNRALFVAIFGSFLALAFLALAEQPQPATPATPSVSATNTAHQTAASPDDPVATTLQLRRAAIEARRAYLAARTAHPAINALERQVRPLIAEVNGVYTRRSALVHDNPDLAPLPANTTNSPTKPAVATASQSPQPPPAAAARQSLAEMDKLIAERQNSIRDLVARQNAIADRDPALLALKAAIQRATDACASNELARARSAVAVQPAPSTQRSQP